MTPEQMQILTAVTARILPSAEGPGALETDVAKAVARALEHRVYQGLAPLILQGLEMLDQIALQVSNTTFTKSTNEDQDRVLSLLEQNPQPQARFLMDTLIRLSLEGFLGDPRHGGNRDLLGWRSLGLRQDATPNCLQEDVSP